MQISHAVFSSPLLPSTTWTQISSSAPYVPTSSGYIRPFCNMRDKVSSLSKHQAKLLWKRATIMCIIYFLVT